MEILVSKPQWIQKETSIDKGTYYQVSTFGVGKDTVCTRVLDTGDLGIVETAVVQEWLSYGLCICRVEKPCVLRPSKFVDKDDVLASSFFAATIVGGLLLLLGSGSEKSQSQDAAFG